MPANIETIGFEDNLMSLPQSPIAGPPPVYARESAEPQEEIEWISIPVLPTHSPTLPAKMELETARPETTEEQMILIMDGQELAADKNKRHVKMQQECVPIPSHAENRGAKWSDLSGKDKARRVLVDWLAKPFLIVALLYFFICSLDLMSSAFRLLGGKEAGEVLGESELLNNPICGLMIGILATVLVQSSSTSTSIVVSIVAAGILEVQPAIFIIMGANIGTSVTNTIVSLTQSADRNEFGLAFAGATIHDMFNWLSVIVLLPLEAATGYLYHVTSAILTGMNIKGGGGVKVELLKVLTKPFSKLIVSIDSKVVTQIAVGEVNASDAKLLKSGKYLMSYISDAGVPERAVGGILLLMSLVMLCACLVFMVKLLHSCLKGRISDIIQKTINSDLPGPLRYFTGIVAILVGAVITFIVQSSSVFTSAMTPLVGLGVIKLERMFPLTLGSNIGTTATGILAALASSGDKLDSSLQIALCHLFFNITGILIWYPLPFMRKLPIFLANSLGNTTAKYRWFAIFYLVMMFLVLPLVVFGLSLVSIWLLVAVGVPFLFILAFVAVVSILQRKKPSWLPPVLRTWDFLPLCLHSLSPIDKVLSKLIDVFHGCHPCKESNHNSSRSNNNGVRPQMVQYSADTNSTQCRTIEHTNSTKITVV